MVGLLALAAPAVALPVTVTSSDLPTCDPLAVLGEVDELGTGFPPDELIASGDTPISLVACVPTDTPAPNVLVTITNLTARDFPDVWYVADPETSLSNVDGLVNGELAFKIDTVGINTPLVFESIAFDGIFSAGETWEFLIDDYFNVLGVPASAFASPGLVGGLSGGDLVSSGSIITPEPGTVSLVGLGLLALLSAARRRQGRR